MAQEAKQTSVAVRSPNDFKPLPELGRPGGEKDGKAGSTDIQFFEEVSTGTRWIGKCGLSAMTKPHVLRQTQQHYEEHYKRARYFDEYREAIGLALYQAVGITTPEVAVSFQLPAKVSADQERSLGDMLEYHQPCLHLMTKFVTGFQVLGKPFITAYQQTSDKSKLTTITTPDNKKLVLKGLGAALAMGCFLLDADCLGGGGANMGYVVQTDEQGKKYAQLVKIDAGTAFSFLEGDAGIYKHDPRKRDMFFGLQAEFILRFDQLSANDQIEFAQTARQILHIPQAVFKSIIDQGVLSGGFTQKQADRILNELIARKYTLLNAFVLEVNAQIKAEVQAARQALLTGLTFTPPAAVFPANSTATAVEEQEDKKDEEAKKVPNSQMALTQLDVAEKKADQERLLSEAARMEGERPEDRAVCRVFQPPSVSAYFTGRVEALTQLAQALETQQGTVVTQSISGLGGVGKTQLAARFAQLASEGGVLAGKPLRYQAVIWLNAERSLDVQFIFLAQTWCGLEKPKVEEAVAAIYRYLKNKRSLLVFDNAIDPHSLTPYLPPIPGKKSFLDHFKSASSTSGSTHVLITSRNPDWGSIPALGLNGFTAQEALDFVRQRLPEANEAEVQTLVDIVSNLPLALSHAVAHIAEGHCSLGEYPTKFALHQLSLGTPITAQGTAEQTVLTTFLLTFIRVKQVHPVIEPILHTCAYLAPEGIAVSWLEVGLAGPENEKGAYSLGRFPLIEVQQGLIALQRHGLLQSNQPGLVDMHRLVQQVVRYQLSLPAQQILRTNVATCFIAIYKKYEGIPSEEPRQLALFPHLEAVVKHYAGAEEDEQLATALVQLGNIYLSALGQPKQSRVYLERALAIQEAHYVKDHYLVAETLVSLGVAYGYLGDVAKKRDFLERALTIQEAHYGRDHYQVAIILTNLGSAYGALGDIAKKRDMLERALLIEKAHYGQDHHQMVAPLINLGNAYGALGDTIKMRDLLEHALTIIEACYGRNHYQVAIPLTNLAVVYGRFGNLAKKRDMLKRALAIQEAHYGRDHYQVANTLMNLGIVHGDSGDPAKQRDLSECALAIQEAHYGRDHYEVANTLVCLGNAYGMLGDIVKKRDLSERALDIQEAHYGRDHYEVANTLMHLGNAYGALGDAIKMRHLLERALAIQEAHYGLDHPILTFTLGGLATAHYALKQTKAALRIAQRTYRILMHHPLYGAKHPQTKKLIGGLQTICQFTLKDLQGRSSVSDSEEAQFLSTAANASPPSAPLLSQHGLANQGVQPAEQRLGQAVLALLAAIETQRKPSWYPDEHLKFTVTTINALAKGEVAFAELCAQSEQNAISPSLARFIQAYVAQHPELHQLNSYPDFARRIKNQLLNGKLDELYAHFDMPKLDLFKKEHRPNQREERVGKSSSSFQGYGTFLSHSSPSQRRKNSSSPLLSKGNEEEPSRLLCCSTCVIA